jgi:hypothetical protein
VNICGQTFSPELIERIQTTIDAEPSLSRRKLSQQVCVWLDWRNAKGDLKEMSCRVALLKLHRLGHIRLPAACAAPPRKAPQPQMQEDCETPPAIACHLPELGHVELIAIKRSGNRLSRMWNQLMDKYHYLGSGPLCGAQMRYLIHSEHYGYLGGFAFSSAAWRLESRDLWIGWDERTRAENLDRVVCNSRFLIVPHVKVPGLASHVLSLCAKRLGKDWQERYGVEPVLLETFVERDRFKGTCYRAANWQHIGQTKGRGRQDPQHTSVVPVKDIYIYPLHRKVREILCEGSPKPVCPTRTVDSGDWAEEEFRTVDLGDQRRHKRLLIIARDFFARPNANVPQACQSRAKTKAAYRFLEDENNTMDKILAPHYETTLSRAQQEKVVLVAQDTTTLNYSTHPATQDLGLIGAKQDGPIGLIVHDTMVFNLEGTPLGLLDVQCWARDPADFGKKHLRAQLDIEQKESNKWLKSFAATAAAQKRCPDTVFVSVGDREADIYELFHLALSNPDHPRLLVRSEHNRLLADGQGHLWDHVASQKLSGIQTVHVPRKKGQPAREAKLEVRFAEVILKPPDNKKHLGELRIWAVLAEEVDAPDGVVPLKWLLLTTLPITSFEEAVEKLEWYCGRWGIEVYHRTLKSGCKIERRQLGAADRIEACLGIDMVVAWRIYHLTKLGRETPDVPCTVFFEECEWKALVAYKTQNPIPPEKPPTLREMTRMVASLGGFLGRKGDGDPGTQTLWLGLQRLDDITDMWKISMSKFAPHLVNPLVSRSPKYG